MTIRRMDHTSVVVHDLPAAIAFFTELGMELEGEAHVDGDTATRVSALPDVSCDIAMMKTPDGHSRLELTRYHHPATVTPMPENAPANTLGLRSIMFEVDDIDATIAALQRHGADLVGERVQYEQSYRLCYLRGPAGIIVALAEALESQ